MTTILKGEKHLIGCHLVTAPYILSAKLAIVICVASMSSNHQFCSVLSPLAPFTHMANAEIEIETANLHMVKLREGR